METAEGDPCTLYMDLPYEHPDHPEVGDWIATAAGSRYLIQQVRVVVPRMAKNQHRRRYVMLCVKLAKHSVPPPDTTTWWLTWHERSPRNERGPQR